LAATVLVADDDADILRVIEINLRLEGFEVVTARDGLDALAKAVTVWPDLVLLDVRMPSLDGYTICARIRADPRLATIPVIMVTANYGSADVEAARQAGADDFLVKPFLPATLLDMAKAILGYGGRQPHRSSQPLPLQEEGAWSGGRSPGCPVAGPDGWTAPLWFRPAGGV
jgi:DNA-binding response OmpR family regulator